MFLALTSTPSLEGERVIYAGPRQNRIEPNCTNPSKPPFTKGDFNYPPLGYGGDYRIEHIFKVNSAR